jgi:PhnB protein
MSAEAGIHIPRGIFLSLLLRPVRNSGTVSFPYIKQASTMTGINPIPDEFHSVTPYLFIRGASEAIEFYKQAFGAEEVFRLPMPDGKLGHAEIQIGDSHVMLADENAEAGAISPSTLEGTSASFLIYVENVDEIYAQALAAGGEVVRPLADQFYGDRTGCLKDPFGHVWTISTHIEDVTPEEAQQRLEAMGEDADANC